MRFVSIVLLLFFCTNLLSGVTQDNLTPQEEIRQLVGSPHGLTWASGPEIANLLARVRQNPAPYIPHLLDAIDLDAISASQNSQAVLAAENAAIVLVQAGGPGGRESLGKKFKSLNSSLDQLQLQMTAREREAGTTEARRASVKSEFVRLRERMNRLVRVKRTIINAFAAVGDPTIKDDALERLSREDYATQLTYVRYLGQAGKGDPRVSQRLESLLKDKRSQLYGSKMLITIIESLKK